VVSHGAPPAPADKLLPLIGVREAVSRASQDIRLSFLLSTKEAKLDEAIWNTMEEVRTRLLEDDDSSWWGTTTQGTQSPDIHKVTRAIVSYIRLAVQPLPNSASNPSPSCSTSWRCASNRQHHTTGQPHDGDGVKSGAKAF
jgi:hypothetical protein